MWAFARGCMRTDLMLKEKAERFDAGPDIRAALAAYRVEDAELEAISSSYSRENLEALRSRQFDRVALGRRGPGLEQVDQLTVELLLGVR